MSKQEIKRIKENVSEYKTEEEVKKSNLVKFLNHLHSFEGKEYPLVNIEISSASHPFYTGVEKRLDTAGRAEKFKARMAKAKK